MLVLRKRTDNCDGSQILTRFKIGVMNTFLFIFTDFNFEIYEKVDLWLDQQKTMGSQNVSILYQNYVLTQNICWVVYKKIYSFYLGL